MSSGHDEFEDDSSGHDQKAFKFTIVDGKVTEVFEQDDGAWKSKSIDDDGSETYTVEGSEVVRTEVKPFGTEITHYADVDADGVYLRASEQWQSSPDAPDDGYHFKFEDDLSYSPSDGDDNIAVRGGEDSHGRARC